MSSNSKRAKACVEDRISDLPQEVLCHILSQFSTRDAVKTSAISKRWKNVWSSLNNLDFNEYEFREGYSILSHRFVDFVDRVLLFRDSTSIHRFRLQCTGSLIHDSLLDRWICTAVRRNAVELDLSMGNYCPYRNSSVDDYSRRKILELPKSLFKCNTLVKLKLLMDPKISANNAPTTSNGFPSLKFLHVTLHYPNSNSVENLISCCAALEDLVIDGEIEVVNIGAHCFNLKISSPKVKRLQISLQLDDLSSRDINCHCRTYIDANVPNLEELDICYGFLVSYSLKNVKFLSKVKIDFKIPGIFVGHTPLNPFFGHADRVRRLFAEISHVKHLSISTYMLMVLGSNNTEFTCWPKLGAIGFQCLPPTFINLQSLELQLKTCYCWQSLMNLLRISPNLEHLVLENDIECTHSVADCGHEWHPPKSVAACLVSHLKTICLRRFQGTRNEMEVAKYLMKHGEVLKEEKLFYLCGNSQLVSNSQLRCIL